MAKEKSPEEILHEKLTVNKKSSWLSFSDKEKEDIFRFSEQYKKFIGESKTERLCAQNVMKMLKDKGFNEISSFKKLKTGDKVFKNVKDKAVIAAIIGKNPEKWQLVGSHMD